MRLFFSVLLFSVSFFVLSVPGFIAGQGQISFAQSFPEFTVTLNSRERAYSIVDKAHYIKDNDKTLSLEDARNIFFEKRRYELPGKGLIKTLENNSTYWLLVNIENRTSHEEWILDFGDVFKGRNGSFKDIKIYDANSGAIQFDLNENKDQTLLEGISFSIPPGEDKLAALKISSQGFFPVIHNLTVLAPNNYITEQSAKFTFANLVMFLLALLFFVYLYCFLITKNQAHLYFAGYFIFALFSLIFYEAVFSLPDWLSTALSPILLSGLAICALGYHKENYENVLGLRIGQLLIHTLAGSFVILAIASFITGFGIFFIPAFFHVLLLALLVFNAVLAFTDHNRARESNYVETAGWLAAFAGYFLTAGASYGVLPFSPGFLLPAFWIGVIIQGLLNIADHRNLFSMGDEDALSRGKKQILPMQEQLEALIQEKENTEYKRLLRVVDRERKMMARLREREVEQTEEMRAAKEAADEANRSKSAFLAVISHEIRTPMTGIMGMVKLLQDSKLTKEQHEYAATIEESGDAMLSLLNDLLDFEKIESGKIELELIDFDLHRLIQSIVTLMRGHASIKSNTIKADLDESVPRYVKGDPKRLKQVLLNLSGNAIKFTENGSIRIQVKSLDEDKDETKDMHSLYFSVEDTGIGISKDAQSNLFNPFTQADPSISRKYGGTGLGLAISQRLIQAMGGYIAVNSTEREGSTFFFTISLPRGRSEQVEILETEDDGQGDREGIPLKILVVDDNRINQKVMIGLLERVGHSVVAIGTAVEALQKVEQEIWDVVLMDIELPNMRGDEVAKRIIANKNPDVSDTPIIALTGNVDDEDAKSYREAGMIDVIGKPAKPETLNRVLSKIQPRSGKFQESERPGNNMKGKTGAKMGNSLVSSSDLREETLVVGDDGEMRHTAYKLTENDDDKSFAKINEAFDLEDDEDSDTDQQQPKRQTDENRAADDGEGMSAEEIFNVEMLQSLKDYMDKDQLYELLDGLWDKNAEIMDRLDSALESRDFADIKKAGHELKGMAGNFGLSQIQDMADKLERYAAQEHIDELTRLIANLPQANRTVKEKIDQWVVD